MEQKSSNENHQNILWLQKIRILAQNTNIINIENYKTKDKELVKLDFLNQLDYKKLAKLLEQNKNWRYTDHQVKIEVNLLKNNFKQTLEYLIVFWQK